MVKLDEVADEAGLPAEASKLTVGKEAPEESEATPKRKWGFAKKGAAGAKEKKEKVPPPPSVPFYKLFAYADPIDYILMFLGCIGAAVHGAALPVFFLFFGKLINSLGTQDLSAVDDYVLYFVYLGAAVWAGGWAEVAFWMQTGERQASHIRSLYLRGILRQEIGFFDMQASSGEIVSRVSSDVLLIQDAISEKVGNFLHFFSTFIAGFAIGFSTVWQLSGVLLAVVPLIAACGATYAIVLTGLTSKEQEAYSAAGSIAEQAISQIRTVYSFVGERKTLEEYSSALVGTRKLGIRGGLAKGLGLGSTFGLLFCAWSLEFYFGANLVADGKTNGGEALTAMLSVIIGGLSLGQALPNLTAFAKGQAAAFVVFETIERAPAISDDENAKDVEKMSGDIELRDVHFTYPSRPDVPIFQGFSLTIPAGKTAALVGSSGSGKSTVVALIERFYDPTAGAVLIDGLDIRSIKLKSLRSHLGLVSQEPALFATSIKENILYGQDGASMDDVIAAAKAANAHDFISALPNAYDTNVGERGLQMSGGQKQRIAIARAILRNPSILLLDEATSALDSESERVVQAALDNVMHGRTTVVIAHRLSTVRNADMIAVVSKGSLVELGTHDELMGKGEGGEYAALVKVQMMAGQATEEKAKESKESTGIDQQVSALSALSDDKGEGQQAGEAGDVAAKGSWLRLFKLSLPEWPFTALATLGAALSGAINPVFGLFLTTVITAYYNPNIQEMKDEVHKWCIVFVILGLVSVAVYTLQHFNFGITGESLVKRVREMMLAAILRNEVAWFDKDENNSGAIAARLASDATLVKAAIGDRISVLVQNLSLILISFVIGLVLNWRMALVVISTFPLLVGAAVVQQAFLKGFAGDQQAAHEKASTVASEAVGNIRTVAALALEEKISSLFDSQLLAPLKRAFVRGQLSGFGFGFSQFVMYSAFGLGLWYGKELVEGGQGSFNDVLKVFMVLIMSSFAVAETLTLAPDLAKGGAVIVSVFKTLDRVPAVDPDDPTGQIAEAVKGDIELKHVKFTYPTRPDVIVLNDFSLRVPAGKTVALVGASGSGKSSVVSLIERFYDPLVGKVTIDGVDIRSYNLRSLRSHIGLVSQEPALFAISIRENILYGKENASEAEVVEAAKAANAHSYISALPQGYDTQVGERGVQLSGGQKQRVAIARAVLKNPSILLLDEATSALDAESERVVQEALDTLMVGRTTIVIAHRLSTIVHADVIAVVQSGQIIEIGSHSELINRQNGAYKTLVTLQTSGGSVA